MFEDIDVETESDEEQNEAYQRQTINSRKVKQKTPVLLMEDYFSDPAFEEALE